MVRKHKKPESRRQKTILFYTLAVVLPGIILGYMAYRGILNDQALREKESRRRLDMESLNFFTAIDSSLLLFLDKNSNDSMLRGSVPVDPCVLAAFERDSEGSTKLLAHQLLYVPDELRAVPPGTELPRSDLNEGIRLEFIDRKYIEALAFYQNKALNTNNQAIKNTVQIAIARLYKKLNQPVKAKTAFEEILKYSPANLLNGQIPLGLAACLEILKINQELGQKDEMNKNSKRFLELLLHPVIEYDENQFDHLYQSFLELQRDVDLEIDSLVRELDTQKVRSDNLIRILIGQDTKKLPDNQKKQKSNESITQIPIYSGDFIILYLARGIEMGIQTGMLIDFPVYINKVSDKLIKELDPDSTINFKIEDKNGHLVYSIGEKDGSGYHSFPFPENLPQLNLMLSENKPGFMATLLTAGSGLYLVVFILILLLMALGFIFTLYTVNEELRMNKLKSEFISNVSHELKSPLTSIRMMTEMLHQRRVSSEDRKSEYYSVMLEETEHLSRLIDNILDFSRLEDDRKKYQFEDLDMIDFLDKFIESIGERLHESGFSIRFNHSDNAYLIRADKQALHQVFYNLLDNALKYSGQSREVNINLITKNDELLVCVKDFGIGISRNDQEKIFERFYRSDDPLARDIKGSGIGLTIVKKIVEAHKGHLTLESSPGEGSTFCIHLPISKNTET